MRRKPLVQKLIGQSIVDRRNKYRNLGCFQIGWLHLIANIPLRAHPQDHNMGTNIFMLNVQ
jgi:hypothetical protein